MTAQRVFSPLSLIVLIEPIPSARRGLLAIEKGADHATSERLRSDHIIYIIYIIYIIDIIFQFALIFFAPGHHTPYAIRHTGTRNTEYEREHAEDLGRSRDYAMEIQLQRSYFSADRHRVDQCV